MYHKFIWNFLLKRWQFRKKYKVIISGTIYEVDSIVLTKLVNKKVLIPLTDTQQEDYIEKHFGFGKPNITFVHCEHGEKKDLAENS